MKLFICSMVFSLIAASALAGPTDLVISEVVEGNGGNFKYVEILNRGTVAVDLAVNQVALKRHTNGGASTGATINLTGSLAPGGRYTIAHNQADITSVLGAGKTANLINAGIAHNGNDSYELVYGAVPTRIDGFGMDKVTGADPGDFAINVVAFRVLSALPNNGNWGDATTPGNNTSTANGFWHVFSIGTSNAGAAAAATFGAGGGASGVEAPVTVSGFSID